MMLSRWIVLFAICLTGLTAKAEYRVFQLEIEDTESGKTRTVTSTLDHLQYRTYNPVSSKEVVRYVDSWMCYENTNQFRPPCQKAEPEGQ